MSRLRTFIVRHRLARLAVLFVLALPVVLIFDQLPDFTGKTALSLIVLGAIVIALGIYDPQ